MNSYFQSTVFWAYYNFRKCYKKYWHANATVLSIRSATAIARLERNIVQIH